MLPRLFLIERTVADWAAALAWYRDRLGLPVAHLDVARSFALLGDPPVHLSLRAGVPVVGDTLVYFQVADLPAELDRLRQLGTPIEADLKLSDEGYRRAIVRDPDGHRVGLFDRPASGE